MYLCKSLIKNGSLFPCGESEGQLYIEFKLIHDNDFKDCEKISHYLGEFCYLSPKQYLYAYKHFASA